MPEGPRGRGPEGARDSEPTRAFSYAANPAGLCGQKTHLLLALKVPTRFPLGFWGWCHLTYLHQGGTRTSGGGHLRVGGLLDCPPVDWSCRALGWCVRGHRHVHVRASPRWSGGHASAFTGLVSAVVAVPFRGRHLRAGRVCFLYPGRYSCGARCVYTGAGAGGWEGQNRATSGPNGPKFQV